MKDWKILYWLDYQELRELQFGLIALIKERNSLRKECKKANVDENVIDLNNLTKYNKNTAKLLSKINSIINNKKTILPVRILNPTMRQSIKHDRSE